MDDPFVVGKLERLAYLRHDREGFAWLEFLVAQQLPQIDAIHVLHEEVEESSGR